MKKLLQSALAMLLLIGAGPTFAAVYLFDLDQCTTAVCTSTNAQVASFTLPSSPAESGFSTGNYFYIDNVPMTYNGSAQVYDVAFYAAPTGGLEIYNGATTILFAESQFSDDQVYTGPESAPTFVPDTYLLQNAAATTFYRLTITETVPEPATWLMMILGFGGVGVALRRQRGISTEFGFASLLRRART